MIKPYSIFFIIVFLSGFSFRDQHKPKAKKTCDVLCALPMNVYTNAASASKKFLLIEDEYVLKAAFVYRFTDYIEWKSFSIDGYFHIAVLGKSQITNPLMEIARTKKVRNNQILL